MIRLFKVCYFLSFQKFFIRSCQGESNKYVCTKNGSCEITRATRTQCQKCRYEKCIKVGMVPKGKFSSAVTFQMPNASCFLEIMSFESTHVLLWNSSVKKTKNDLTDCIVAQDVIHMTRDTCSRWLNLNQMQASTNHNIYFDMKVGKIDHDS